MSDPKDELGQRFEDRRPDSEDDPDPTANTSNTDNLNNPSNSDNTSSSREGGSSKKPGPDPSPDSTRNRRQVPMYLPDEQADQLNSLYEQLDGRSKVAGKGGIEKHADFMEAVVDFAIEHEEDLAARLDIEMDSEHS
ncbi:hypothetical protein G6M89_21765 [Natronolimnobius sp. AArcel1]|uniref:hypothetical protein n=1 Tax=Natronolimnobius sp. AArcel1 TaxID=1679093 RepID=UPI0013EA2CB2|nr:hypothetical protein [Natronolimnobius sp. AArcel1]NGM71575.1 hypothetical protein [Natronolimnobius sp. AArcel1]